MPKTSVYLYTDGCNSGKTDNNARVGSGVWASERPSTKVTTHTISKSFPNDGTNNIKGEIMAVIEGLTWAYSMKYAIVVVVTDLEGITQWADGKWKRNKPITVQLYDTVTSMREKGIDIRFIWTHGHTKDQRHSYGNDLADKLAAESLGKNKKEIIKYSEELG